MFEKRLQGAIPKGRTSFVSFIYFIKRFFHTRFQSWSDQNEVDHESNPQFPILEKEGWKN